MNSEAPEAPETEKSQTYTMVRHTHITLHEPTIHTQNLEKQANSSEKKRVKGNKSFLLYFHAVLAIVNVR